MRDSIVVLFAAAFVLAACGSDPKPEPVSPPAPAPSATPASSTPPVASAAPEADAGKSDKQADCDLLVDDANSTLDSARIAVDKVCKKDADCMPIKARACGFACVTGAIPKAEEKDWNDALTKASASCKKWTDNECNKLRQRPPQDCKDRKIACEKGRCTVH